MTLKLLYYQNGRSTAKIVDCVIQVCFSIVKKLQNLIENLFSIVKNGKSEWSFYIRVIITTGDPVIMRLNM